MRKYARLFLKIISYNLKQQMQFRANFLLSIPVHLSWTVKEVIVIYILYNYTDIILGWKKNEFIFLLGTYFIIDSIVSCIILPNLQNLSEHIRAGFFDHVLLKPMDSQFYTLTYFFNMGVMAAALVGIFLVMYAGIGMNLKMTIFSLLGYLIFVLSGIVIFASILIIAAVPVFKTVKIDYIRNVFICIANVARKPISIFPDQIKKALYGCSIAFISYIPSCFALGKLGFKSCCLSIPVAIVLLFVNRKLWKKGIESYVSIS
jgi:ABC-type uncharacterized transport system, permease component